jgi:hypothetical protein
LRVIRTSAAGFSISAPMFSPVFIERVRGFDFLGTRVTHFL